MPRNRLDCQPDETGIVEVPLNRLLDYLGGQTGEPLPMSTRSGPHGIIDWHLVLREGLRSVLHVNLGIPGVECPEDPIEENHAALYAAIVLGWDTLPVLFSGELERACRARLISRKAMSNLRNIIRVSG